MCSDGGLLTKGGGLNPALRFLTLSFTIQCFRAFS